MPVYREFAKVLQPPPNNLVMWHIEWPSEWNGAWGMGMRPYYSSFMHIPVCSWRPSGRCREPLFRSSSPPAPSCHWAASWSPVVSGGGPGRKEAVFIRKGAERCMQFVLWHINTATVGCSEIESTFHILWENCVLQWRTYPQCSHQFWA